jgi:VIT1/CCC1 family predicted Fe2+/Mn2+ transporter
MAHDALGTHAREELGISHTSTARPLQAALTSAATFSVGAALPLLVMLLVPAFALVWAVAGSALLFLVLLSSLAATAGGAPVLVATLRVSLWGELVGCPGDGGHSRYRGFVRRQRLRQPERFWVVF